MKNVKTNIVECSKPIQTINITLEYIIYYSTACGTRSFSGRFYRAEEDADFSD